MYPLPNKCPICESDYMVSRIHCSRCDTSIEGHFEPSSSPFRDLSQKQIQFLLAFVRCEGRFTRLEEELKLSYPTLRNRLNEIIRALGYEPGRDETPAPLSSEDRKTILEDLANGKISSKQAQELLRGKEIGNQSKDEKEEK
ncbi:MAG: DUF2089 domain-containing protein [Anaerolineaceae bacterium]|nr:DUF2089 domain-containing protein [Anaerolineaceae bacterium]